MMREESSVWDLLFPSTDKLVLLSSIFLKHLCKVGPENLSNPARIRFFSYEKLCTVPLSCSRSTGTCTTNLSCIYHQIEQSFTISVYRHSCINDLQKHSGWGYVTKLVMCSSGSSCSTSGRNIRILALERGVFTAQWTKKSWGNCFFSTLPIQTSL